MSSLLSKKQSHTWQKSVYAWRPLDQDGQGEFMVEGSMGEVLQAIANKVATTQYDQMAGHVDPSRESRPSRRP